MEPTNTPEGHVTRRRFIQGTSAIAGASMLTSLGSIPTVHAGGGDPIRFCLVGCGGRGTGAAAQIMNSPHPTKLVAMADAFMDKVDGSYARLSKQYKDKVDVPAERRFAGFDAFQKAIDSDVDLVVLATPPGFRPPHLKYATEQKKHVFMEKPVAVDGTGVRSVLESTARAKKNGKMLAVGLQRRHQPNYNETIKRLQDGAIGDINYMRAFWNSSGVWNRKRKPGATEMAYQMRNWYYFNWLCGDHIVEQHIHNLDVCNWLKNDFPVRANGMGGRQVRTGKQFGEIYDHHFVEYEYADGSRMYSQCRHIQHTPHNVSEHAYGSKGECNISGSHIKGENAWKFGGKRVSGHQQEQLDMIDSLVKGEVYNEGHYGAMSTMTAILGRLVTYSGQNISMKDALNSKKDMMPKVLTWEADPPTLPDADGWYPVAKPGVTKVI
ncbi:MAG: Gfo/Idh/MocA family oxidoreductase [Planctomycetota bacterium]